MTTWCADDLRRVEHTWQVIFLLGNQEIAWSLLSNAFSRTLIITVLAGNVCLPTEDWNLLKDTIHHHIYAFNAWGSPRSVRGTQKDVLNKLFGNSSEMWINFLAFKIKIMFFKKHSSSPQLLEYFLHVIYRGKEVGIFFLVFKFSGQT